jgi:nickel/cobalt transporter (NicO) family protein
MAGMRPVLLVAALGALVTVPSVVNGHRLDEYLQATRIAVRSDAVDLEIDLTAGVGIAPDVWALVDADRNGRISAAEGRNYAQRVLHAVVLQVDERPRALTLVSSRYPTFRAINSGSGTIHLEARAALRQTTAGTHRLLYRNTHRPGISVYLVNALVPKERAISIASLTRDPRQRQMVMTYDVQ